MAEQPYEAEYILWQNHTLQLYQLNRIEPQTSDFNSYEENPVMSSTTQDNNQIISDLCPVLSSTQETSNQSEENTSNPTFNQVQEFQQKPVQKKRFSILEKQQQEDKINPDKNTIQYQNNLQSDPNFKGNKYYFSLIHEFYGQIPSNIDLQSSNNDNSEVPSLDTQQNNSLTQINFNYQQILFKQTKERNLRQICTLDILHQNITKNETENILTPDELKKLLLIQVDLPDFYSKFRQWNKRQTYNATQVWEEILGMKAKTGFEYNLLLRKYCYCKNSSKQHDDSFDLIEALKKDLKIGTLRRFVEKNFKSQDKKFFKRWEAKKEGIEYHCRQNAYILTILKKNSE